MPEHDWLYLRVYLKTPGEGHDIVERIVAPTMLRFQMVYPDLRWFYLWYTDLVGPHLRLRLRAPSPQLAAFEAELEGELGAAFDGPDAHVDGRSGLGGSSSGHLVAKRLYEPEYAKYGGAQGVDLAESLMCLGSQTAARLAQPRYRQSRSLLAAAHTHLMVRELDSAHRVSFLHQYAWYWSARGTRKYFPDRKEPVLEWSDAESVRRAVTLRREIDAMLADEEAARLLGEYVARFWRTVRSTDTHRTDYLAAAHHIHLMNNRLGVSSVHERQIARLLWLEATCGERRTQC